jgi:hypothetical protein
MKWLWHSLETPASDSIFATLLKSVYTHWWEVIYIIIYDQSSLCGLECLVIVTSLMTFMRLIADDFSERLSVLIMLPSTLIGSLLCSMIWTKSALNQQFTLLTDFIRSSWISSLLWSIIPKKQLWSAVYSAPWLHKINTDYQFNLLTVP